MSHDLSPLGFRKTPFTRELTVRERLPLDPQAQVAAALTAAVQERMSAALIAPAGTGKTVALRMLVAALPETRFQVHYVKVTGLSKRDLCKEIAVACGLRPPAFIPLWCANCRTLSNTPPATACARSFCSTKPAWSKGLRERVVVMRHAVKNALIPVVSLIGLQLPILVGGAVIMENIFNLPGLGRLLLNALNDRDYPMVSGINLFFATGVVGINLFIDLLYAVVDPRVRYD